MPRALVAGSNRRRNAPEILWAARLGRTHLSASHAEFARAPLPIVGSAP